MKLLTIILTFVVSILSAHGLGRSSTFTHLDKQVKPVVNHTFFLSFTGTESGLWIHSTNNIKMAFPKGQSFVLTPAGRRINLDFSIFHELEGSTKIWAGNYTIPHKMIKGIYHYHILVSLNGVNHVMKHRIDYDFKKISKYQSEALQK
jgi:hypothetical protein